METSSFVETRLARQRAAELKREEIAANAREAKEKKERDQENRKKVNEMRRGRMGSEESLGYSEGERQRGFSIDRTDFTRDWSEDSEPNHMDSTGSDNIKRPAVKAPDNKMTPSGSRSQSVMLTLYTFHCLGQL